MLALVVNVPFLQDAFGATSLAPQEWLLIVGLAFLIVPVLETAKWVMRGRDSHARSGRRLPMGPLPER